MGRTPLPAGPEKGGLRHGGVRRLAGASRWSRGTRAVAVIPSSWTRHRPSQWSGTTPGARGSALASPPSRLRHGLRPRAMRSPLGAGSRWRRGERGGRSVRKGCRHRQAPRERLPEGYAEETSLAHMTRVATEARSKAMTDWITDHVRPGRRYRPPPGKGVRRTQLRRVKKTLAGRYYQLLSGHAETGSHRHRFGRTDSPAC